MSPQSDINLEESSDKSHLETGFPGAACPILPLKVKLEVMTHPVATMPCHATCCTTTREAVPCW
ncbi:Hypothetical predicted protein [Podarcis lilfordi]|uniref:Uncharacterized protein n=1 Tax=Podarcis lilfordi TaxID=74358 RepID=A0AA35L184_9SAUR|nr:Hypothetical predicted protein [Podarcis lilfordi]